MGDDLPTTAPAPAPDPTGPDADPTGPTDDRRKLLVALGAGVVVLVLLIALVLATRDGDDEEATTGSTTTEAETTTTAASTTGSSSTTEATTTAPSTTAGPTTSPPTTATTSPVPSTTPGGGASTGAPGPGCVDGWTTPAPGTARRTEPLDEIRAQMDVDGRFEVLDMRYFTGPEIPEIVSPRPPFLEWWYVKARLVDDPSVEARWLVVRRSPQVVGVASVANIGTSGFRSPDWLAFVGDGTPRPVPGVPGLWVGLQYDFVTGEPGEAPGLPVENRRCLDGT